MGVSRNFNRERAEFYIVGMETNNVADNKSKAKLSVFYYIFYLQW